MADVDIVLIEDNRHDIEMMLDAFREHKLVYKVIALRDGVEGLDYFFGPQGCILGMNAILPKLVMLDLKLPRINGLEVLKRLKSDERTRNMPVVIFTSSNEFHDRIDSYALGANSFMVKPLDADVFSRFVARIGRYWVGMNVTAYV